MRKPGGVTFGCQSIEAVLDREVERKNDQLPRVPENFVYIYIYIGVHGKGLPVKIMLTKFMEVVLRKFYYSKLEEYASGLSLSESKPIHLLKFEGNATRCGREVQFLCFLVG